MDAEKRFPPSHRIVSKCFPLRRHHRLLGGEKGAISKLEGGKVKKESSPYFFSSLGKKKGFVPRGGKEKRTAPLCEKKSVQKEWEKNILGGEERRSSIPKK